MLYPTNSTKTITTYSTSSHVKPRNMFGKTAVVIDVLRATTSMLAALDAGCKEIVPVDEVGSAMSVSRRYNNDYSILAGERDMHKINGFDLSNSPLDFTKENVEGKSIIMTTTNGTRAVRTCEQAEETVICALVNVDTVALLLKDGKFDISIVCAGTNDKFSLDDIVCAGALATRLVEYGFLPDDLTIASMELYQKNRDNLSNLLQKCSHYKKLIKAYPDDIDYCLKENTLNIAGIYWGGIIKKISI